MSLCRYFPTPSDRMGILWSLLCIEDSVVLEYGPAGTTHYSISLFGGLGVDQQNRLFTTHMSEDDVVMGDVSRLERALVEVDQNYAPRVIFVVASSVSAVIGTDLRGVCAYMQEKVRARLIAFEQGGFRGDYSAGLCETYRLIAEQAVAPAQKRAENTYNLLGLSAGAYRARSDRNEIVRLMRAAFGMEMHACLCLDTDMRAVETCGAARLNLVLRGEALPAARILAETCHTPYVAGAPYGYAGTLAWLERVAAALGQPIAPELVRELKEKSLQASCACTPACGNSIAPPPRSTANTKWCAAWRRSWKRWGSAWKTASARTACARWKRPTPPCATCRWKRSASNCCAACAISSCWPTRSRTRCSRRTTSSCARACRWCTARRPPPTCPWPGPAERTPCSRAWKNTWKPSRKPQMEEAKP